jgi:5'-nucleotidase
VPAEYEGAPVTPDATVAKALAPGVEAARSIKTNLLGITLSTPLRRTDRLDSPIGHLFTDAFLAAVPGAVLAINNTQGALRADMPAGPVTYGTVFEVMPFDNRVVAFHMTAADVRKMVATWMADRLPATPGIAGLRIRVSCQGPALDVALIRPNGQPVEDRERLLVVTTDFLATNGDNVFDSVLPPNGFTVEQDAGTVRDVVIGALKQRGATLAEAQLLDGPNPRWILPGARPLKCNA